LFALPPLGCGGRVESFYSLLSFPAVARIN
jgi:hypothetical protein